jgi:exonuclease 3'-5' domain-containing protein 1
VYDLQLLELAKRVSRGEATVFLHGLKRCIETHLGSPAGWRQCKEAGLKLFLPSAGGSYEVFEQRPLDERLVMYCAQDVALLFHLEQAMRGGVGKEWEAKILRESAGRVRASQSAVYNGKGPHMAMAPARWYE